MSEEHEEVREIKLSVLRLREENRRLRALEQDYDKLARYELEHTRLMQENISLRTKLGLKSVDSIPSDINEFYKKALRKIRREVSNGAQEG